MALPPTSTEDFQELLAEAAKLKTAQLDHKVKEWALWETSLALGF
jgi:hypothetical protein